MRILHVVPSYIPAWRYGGPIHSVHGLCRALAARGHEVAVATTNVDGESDSDVPLDHAVDMEGISVRYFPSHALRRLYYSPPLRRYLAAEVPKRDLVHTHSVFLWPTSIAARVARRTRKPYVLSPRGMLVRNLIERRNPLLKRAWIRMFERRNVELAAAIHVTSDLERMDLLDLGFRPRKVIDIPNGFDIPASDKPPPAHPRAPASYALFLGRVSWKKGLDRLVSALPRAPDVNLVVAGNDDEDYWPKIARLARDLGVERRIYYVGFVEGNDKTALLANASMLVLPSYSENFGNVVLEAMAASVPVVVTPEVGASQIVARSRCGVVARGNAESLGHVLSSLQLDEARRVQMGRNGRAAASAFSWDGIARRFEEEYLMLIGA